ncbi:HD domain-containing phosphohydrolase [Fusibacter sp. JL216-2]|uniref:HD domain-containing phosphohydrolase n=1 Tax=Fusibacter sp. JL216-2 TaxID=3071453 RepID=UPI003D32D87B
MNWITVKLRRLSTKLYLVFILMFITLTSVVVTSYVAIETQRQHLILTDVLGEQEILTERVTFTLTSIGEMGLNNVSDYKDIVNEKKEFVDTYYNRVKNILIGFKNYEFEYTPGNVIELDFSDDFRVEFDKAVDITLEIWNEMQIYKDHLTDPQQLEDRSQYKMKLEELKVLNDKILDNAGFVARICREEAERKMALSKKFQYGSIVFSMGALVLLIYLITANFYNPIVEIRAIFKKMSKGDLTERFQRTRADEFKDLYDNFNFFLNNLETIFKLEDKIIFENQLDDILLYMFSEFGAFIPFIQIRLEYETLHGTHIERIISGGDVTEYEHDDHLIKKYDDVTRVASRIALPIKVEKNNFGTLYLEFDSEDDIEESHISFTKLLKEKIAFAFYKGFFLKNLLTIVTNGLSEMTEARDPETGNHLKRMSLYSQIIASRLYEAGVYKEHINKAFVENILICAPMHDIGKASIPDSILLKPGKLTDDEYEIMKTHAAKGYEVLEHIDRDFKRFNVNYFSMAAQIALGHQEKYDGSGYPGGKKALEIPIEARICALADVFDALTSRRPYKEAFPLDKSYQIIKESSGSHFDPEVVDAFFSAQHRIEMVYHAYKEI